MAKYSFIVPVYNCGEYLLPCVQSLLDQTCKDFEILLVDDGSTDRSGEICDCLDLQYPNVHAFHKENGGAASARNHGVEHAVGRYLSFVDGDDTLDPLFLETVDEAIEMFQPCMVITGMSFDYYEGGVLARSSVLSSRQGIQTRDAWLADFYDGYVQNCFSSSCAKVFQRQLLDTYHIRFDDKLFLFEDFHFTLNYLKHTGNIVYLSQGFYHYRINLENNRFYDRIKDISKLDYMLSALRNALQFIEAVDSLKIRCGIVSQIILETCKLYFGYPAKMKAQLSALSDSNEFLLLSEELGRIADYDNPSISAVRDKRYFLLWLKILYLTVRSTVKKVLRTIW